VEAGTNETGDTAAEGESPEKDANGEPISGQAISQAPGIAAGFGFNPSAGGAFPMGFGGDFNQMQMMMAMQNGGMGPNAFGNFPMMGMFALYYLVRNKLTSYQQCLEWAWIR
jgi:hypothetical protein